MSDLTPDKLRDALDAAGCRDHPGNPDPDCHVCIIDEAARRYTDALERGIVIVPNEGGEWPEWALETAKPWEQRLMEDGNYSLFARNGRDILDALRQAMKDGGGE